MRSIIVIAHNLRSAHNVGSLLRTADGLGIDRVYLTGYSPFPIGRSDKRLPHIARKAHKQISKTALGAEGSIKWEHYSEIESVIEKLKKKDYYIVALEQTSSSVSLQKFKPSSKIALIIGREVEGIEPAILKMSDNSVEIPMLGKKESLNVVQAAAIAMYHCRYFKV